MRIDLNLLYALDALLEEGSVVGLPSVPRVCVTQWPHCLVR